MSALEVLGKWQDRMLGNILCPAQVPRAEASSGNEPLHMCIKMRSLAWALVESDQCPNKRRKRGTDMHQQGHS